MVYFAWRDWGKLRKPGIKIVSLRAVNPVPPEYEAGVLITQLQRAVLSVKPPSTNNHLFRWWQVGTGRRIDKTSSTSSTLCKELMIQSVRVVVWVRNLVSKSEEKTDWGYLRTKCRWEYLELREMKWWRTGEHYIIRSFIICSIGNEGQMWGM
jgi:hypothetical protein